MSAATPIAAVANAIVALLRSNLAAFEPDLKLVQLDEYWSTSASVAKLGERMPCVLVAMRSVEPANNQGLSQTCAYGFDLNYFIGLNYAGSNRTTVFENLQRIAELLVDGDYSDALQVSGLEVTEVRIGQIVTQSELLEQNIAWGVVPVTVEAISL